MKLHLISNDNFFLGELDVITKLLACYEFIFHLRKPKATVKEYNSFLKRIPATFHNRIMLHGAYELIQYYNLKGLHFSTINRKNKDKITTNYCSTSAHSIKELTKLDGQFQSIFISPIFPSISKPGYVGKLNLIALKSFLKQSRHSKIIALGGITAKNINMLGTFNFDGFAVLGAVWKDNPTNIWQISQHIDDILKNITQNRATL